VDRHPDLPVAPAARGGHVLDVPADAVFRAEEGGKPDAPRFVEQVRGVTQAPVHRRGVAYESYRKPPKGGEALLDEHVEAGPDLFRATPGDRACLFHYRGRYHNSFGTSGVCHCPETFFSGGRRTLERSSSINGKEVAMQERKGVITFKGNPMTLLGPEIKAGDKAPDFRVVDTGLAPVTLADFKGKVKIISAVPSLDTPTCDTETRRFNQEAAKLPGNVVVLTVSLDLPFAQKRWCAAAGIDKVKTLSDYQDRSFASAYGVLIKELKLLSRSIFVVDGSDTVRYVQHVKEVSQEPDYAAVLAAAKSLQ
jgi:thiol peroxidase